MKEKKVKISRENWDYLVDKLQYILAKYLRGGESDEVIAKFENLLEIDNSEKNEMWMNIYKVATNLIPGGYLYDTKKEAKAAVKGDKNYVTTTKVCWEE